MVTFVSIKTTSDSNYLGLAATIAATFTSASGNETFFKVNASGGQSANFSGTGFVYNDDGVPIDGTVTSIALKIGAETIALISGLSLDVSAVAAAFLPGGDPTAVLDMFGDMRVRGNIGDDTLGSGNGDDVFLGGRGADHMNGRDGVDTVDYSGAPAGLTASLTNPAINTGHAQGDTYDSIANLIGSKFNDRLVGNASANALTGGNGNDNLAGGANRDTLTGGKGNDTLLGGRGVDQLLGGLGDDVFRYNKLNEGRDQVNFLDPGDTIQFKASILGLDPGDTANFVSNTSPSSPTAAFLFDTDDRTLIWDANGSAAGGQTLILTLGAGAIQAGDIVLI